MKVINYTDQKLLDLIHGGGRDLETAFIHLMKNEKKYKPVRKLIMGLGGSYEEYEEIFDDTLVALHSSIRKGNFQKTHSINAYMQGIAKNMWYKKWQEKQKKQLTEQNQLPEKIPSVEFRIIEDERRQILVKLMGKLGENCQKILVKSFYEGYKNSELLHLLNYKSDGVVRKKKSTCLKKLIELIKDDPQILKELSS